MQVLRKKIMVSIELAQERANFQHFLILCTNFVTALKISIKRLVNNVKYIVEGFGIDPYIRALMFVLPS